MPIWKNFSNDKVYKIGRVSILEHPVYGLNLQRPNIDEENKIIYPIKPYKLTKAACITNSIIVTDEYSSGEYFMKLVVVFTEKC